MTDNVIQSPLVVNFFGGPGVGKSTTAAGVFYYLKRLLINAELVTEYAKELVWEQHDSMLEDQVMIFANQHRKIERLRDKVDVVITDSPLLLGALYSKPNTYNSLTELMFESWNSFNNFNIVLQRVKPYQQAGRIQTEDQAKMVDCQVRELLDKREIEYTTINASQYYDVAIHIVDSYIKPRLKSKVPDWAPSKLWESKTEY